MTWCPTCAAPALRRRQSVARPPMRAGGRAAGRRDRSTGPRRARRWRSCRSARPRGRRAPGRRGQQRRGVEVVEVEAELVLPVLRVRAAPRSRRTSRRAAPAPSRGRSGARWRSGRSARARPAAAAPPVDRPRRAARCDRSTSPATVTSAGPVVVGRQQGGHGVDGGTSRTLLMRRRASSARRQMAAPDEHGPDLTWVGARVHRGRGGDRRPARGSPRRRRRAGQRPGARRQPRGDPIQRSHARRAGRSAIVRTDRRGRPTTSTSSARRTSWCSRSRPTRSPTIADRLRRVYDDDTVVVPVQNGVPWWFFQKFPGPFEGRRLRVARPRRHHRAAHPGRPHRRLHRLPGGRTGQARESSAWSRVIASRSASSTATRSERVTPIAQALTAAGFTSRVLTDIRSHLWVKAWGNLAMNPISALTGGDAGRDLPVARPPGRSPRR